MWSQEHELAALGAEVADAWGRQIFSVLYAQVTGKSPRPGDLPEPLRVKHPGRPEPEQPKRKKASIAEIAGAFTALKK